MVLMEELVEEILIRFPPAEPASLVRAALVCKPWCRLISGRRFREFHRSPPMLGYFCNLRPKDTGDVSRFFPASSACPRYADQVQWSALDARHGRVLLYSLAWASPAPRLSVWDPITAERWELPQLSDVWDWEEDEDYEWNGAVLCAASGGGACDHLDCRGKPFLVVFAASAGIEHILLCIYSSETGSWSEPTLAAPKPEYGVTHTVAPAIVGNTLYFMADMGFSFLRYDLVTREISMIKNVAIESDDYSSMPMAIEDGGNGMAVGYEADRRLAFWSMETSTKGDIVWKKNRVTELNELSPMKICPEDVHYFAFVPGFRILVAASQRLFTIDLKSNKVEVANEGPFTSSIVPYMSFYIPALESFSAVDDIKNYRAVPSESRSKCATCCARKHCGKPLQVRRQEQVPEVLAKLKVLLREDLGQWEFDSSR